MRFSEGLQDRKAWCGYGKEYYCYSKYGHWHYTDDQGYKYEFVTENQKGVLTRLAITYPTN